MTTATSSQSGIGRQPVRGRSGRSRRSRKVRALGASWCYARPWPVDATPPPTPLDHAISRLVRGALSAYGEDAASITREVEYYDAAGMYFTEVEPARTGAMSVSLGCDGCCWGGDTVLVTFGSTSFEVFPFRDDSDLAYLRQLVDAVLAGRWRRLAGNTTRSPDWIPGRRGGGRCFSRTDPVGA